MRHALTWLALWLVLACTAVAPERGGTEGYLRYVWFEVPGGERVLMRWRDGKMPLRVHLPAPDPSLVADAGAVLEAVRDGVTDWTDAAGPGVPSFVFVDSPGAADIPIVWEAEPSGDWYIAHCVYDVNLIQRRFGVARILVTTRYRGRSEVPLQELYETVLHETGHALGLAGHSPNEADIMYYRGTWASRSDGISEGDRATLRALYAKPNGQRVTGAKRTD
jgi:predicted Zn-dependent protease